MNVMLNAICELKCDDLDVFLTRKKMKNIYLRVESPSAKIKASAPLKMPIEKIRDFVISKFDWIKKQQEKAKTKQREVPQHYVDGDIVYFNGKGYALKIIEQDHRPKVHLEEAHFVLYVRPSASTAIKVKLLEAWYHAQLNIKVAELIAYWQPKMGVMIRQFKIRKMKTRWGSCSPHSKTIRINFELVKKSFDCLEYIVVHELVHLLEPSHNQRFVEFMNKFLPNWRVCKKQLHDFSHDVE